MPSGIVRTCLNAFHERVAHEDYFIPVGRDICTKCKCLAGRAVGCISETCEKRPDCSTYKRVQGKCCEFECVEDDGLSNKAELAVILSLSVGLVLLLIILITILYCRRQSLKKSQEQEKQQQKSSDSKTETTEVTTEQEQPNNTENNAPANSNNTSSIETSQPESSRESTAVELPPPYSPPQSIVTENKGRTRPALPPNEPPPPYDREESSV